MRDTVYDSRDTGQSLPFWVFPAKCETGGHLRQRLSASHQALSHIFMRCWTSVSTKAAQLQLWVLDPQSVPPTSRLHRWFVRTSLPTPKFLMASLTTGVHHCVLGLPPRQAPTTTAHSSSFHNGDFEQGPLRVHVPSLLKVRKSFSGGESWKYSRQDPLSDVPS